MAFRFRWMPRFRSDKLQLNGQRQALAGKPVSPSRDPLAALKSLQERIQIGEQRLEAGKTFSRKTDKKTSGRMPDEQLNDAAQDHDIAAHSADMNEQKKKTSSDGLTGGRPASEDRDSRRYHNLARFLQKSESNNQNETADGLRRAAKQRLLPRLPSVEENRQQNIQDAEAIQKTILGNIVVVAFVGSSGTGKSTQAIRVARENLIDYLIDDGLLIHGSRILAGTSAKKAKTRLESVRQALFLDPTRAANMRRALTEQQPTTLMIIGTSENMLEKICSALWLNQPAMLIRIEDVTTEEQRLQARNTRLSEGQHTIPVPSMEIKHEFSGYFADPIYRLRQRFDRGTTTPNPDAERTVVRPTFSSLGAYSISDDALQNMIRLIVKRVRGVAEVMECRISKEVYGAIFSIGLTLYFGYNAQDVMRRVQNLCSQMVERYTSINVLAVNVRAIRLISGVKQAPTLPQAAPSAERGIRASAGIL